MLRLNSEEDEIHVARKKQIKDSKIISATYDPDFVAFRHVVARVAWTDGLG
jgi:hypothetical protein